MSIARDLANVASLMASSAANVVFDDSIVITGATANSFVYLDAAKKLTTATPPAGGVTYTSLKTSNYTAATRDGVMTDTSAGAFTVTLPATPSSGDYVVIADAGASWGTNNLTVGRNGSTIGGLAQDLVCDIRGARVELVYDGTTWEVYTQIGGQGGSAVTLSDTQTLTNKTINVANNTIAGVVPNSILYFNSSNTATSNASLTYDGANLTFGSTGQRIRGDFSNGTIPNRVAFQTSTVNGSTTLVTIPNGTGVNSGYIAHNNSDPTNSSRAQFAVIGNTEVHIMSAINGTGTYLPMTFYTGNLERMRIDTSGNVAFGTSSTGSTGLTLAQSFNLAWDQSATESIANIFRQTSSAATVIANGYKRSANSNAFTSSYSTSWAKTAISLGTSTGAITFYTDPAYANTVGTDVTPSERMRIDSSGNVGIGTASPVAGYVLNVVNDSGNAQQLIRAGTNFNSTISFGDQASNISGQLLYAHNGDYMRFDTNGSEQFRITSTGGITSANLADAVGYKGTPLNEQSAAYTLVIGDMGKSIVHPASDNNARTFTIPANGTVAFPVGTTISFINMINTLTIAITSDTMYLAGTGSTGSRTLAAYGMATAVKMTSTTWMISGNGLT